MLFFFFHLINSIIKRISAVWVRALGHLISLKQRERSSPLIQISCLTVVWGCHFVLWWPPVICHGNVEPTTRMSSVGLCVHTTKKNFTSAARVRWKKKENLPLERFIQTAQITCVRHFGYSARYRMMTEKKLIHLAKTTKRLIPHQTADEPMMSRCAARGLWRNQVKRRLSSAKGKKFKTGRCFGPERRTHTDSNDQAVDDASNLLFHFSAFKMKRQLSRTWSACSSFLVQSHAGDETQSTATHTHRATRDRHPSAGHAIVNVASSGRPESSADATTKKKSQIDHL